MGVPTQGEKFAEFIEYIRKASEAAAMLGHLAVSGSETHIDKTLQSGWYGISQLLDRIIIQATRLAAGKLN